MAPVPVTVLTGFLGSGKTTLLNALLRQPGMANSAVLVNEFGEVGIDHLLVEAVDEDVVLLDSGCLCCSVRDDLVVGIASLLDRRNAGSLPPFDRVLIETSGLADPAPILHALLGDRRLRGRCSVNAIVATVDALHGFAQLDEHPEPPRQAALADRLVLTKTDLAAPGAVAALRGRLQALNPGATLLQALHGALDPRLLLDSPRGQTHPAGWEATRWLGLDVMPHDPPAARHDTRIRAIALHAGQPLELTRFVAWVEALLAAQGERVLRLKGILDALGSERPVVVHGVRHVFHPLHTLPAWPDGARSSRLVVIGEELDAAALRHDFERMVQGGAASA